MEVTKKYLDKSQMELTVELSWEEFKPFINDGAAKLAQEIKIDGFRPGKIPYEILKQKIGEITILKKTTHVAINKTIQKALEKYPENQPVGQPQINITKLAPDNPLNYKITVALLPSITLGTYKNLGIKKENDKLTDAEIDKMLGFLKDSRVQEKITDQPAKENDKVIVDIEMFLDKVPVDGGQNKDTAVIIGSNHIVPGFDKKLIGIKKDEEREFSLPYPEDYHMANLAGKIVEFKVRAKNIYERLLPELDDKFAASLGTKNMEELKGNIRKELQAEKNQRTEQKFEIKIIDKIIGASKFGDLPEVLINQEAETMLQELEQQVTSQGGKFNDYLASIKKTRAQLILDMMPDAVKRIKTALLMREVSLQEKIKATDDEIEKKVEELLKQYQGYEKVEARIKEPGYKDYLRTVITNRKVIEKLKEWNKANKN